MCVNYIIFVFTIYIIKTCILCVILQRNKTSNSRATLLLVQEVRFQWELHANNVLTGNICLCSRYQNLKKLFNYIMCTTLRR